MRRLLLLFGLLWGVIACADQGESLFVGRVVEVEMDCLTLRSEQDDEATFLIEGAELINFNSLVEGAPVRVLYRGKLDEAGENRALRVEVDPTYYSLLGRWIEVDDGSREYGMGIELLPDGKLLSIGMQTMLFKTWELTEEGGLWLAGHMLSNGQTVAIGDEWRIVDLTPTEMILSLGELTLYFSRETEADVEARLAREAAATKPERKKR